MTTGAAQNLHYHVLAELVDDNEVVGMNPYSQVFDTQSDAWEFAGEEAADTMGEMAAGYVRDVAKKLGIKPDEGNTYRSDDPAEGEPEVGVPFGTVAVKHTGNRREVRFQIIPCDGDIIDTENMTEEEAERFAIMALIEALGPFANRSTVL